jgi:RNA polymerase-binding transcription factor
MSATNARNAIHSNRRNTAFEALLRKKKEELARKLNFRLGDVTVEQEPDDEGDVANRNFAKDLAVVTLERERRELAEIDAALARIKKGGFGICEVCEEPIREARLQALPWARLCIRCASGTTSVAAD